MLDLASKQAQPLEIFEFMRQHDICQGQPLYYLAVASETERNGELADASEAYKRAVRIAEGRRNRAFREERAATKTNFLPLAQSSTRARASTTPSRPRRRRWRATSTTLSAA